MSFQNHPKKMGKKTCLKPNQLIWWYTGLQSPSWTRPNTLQHGLLQSGPAQQYKRRRPSKGPKGSETAMLHRFHQATWPENKPVSPCFTLISAKPLVYESNYSSTYSSTANNCPPDIISPCLVAGGQGSGASLQVRQAQGWTTRVPGGTLPKGPIGKNHRKQ